ncbi:MAG: hypothetical protein GY820_03630 [Gammaproteobacteria bacterium]|nr:hypothetical protein [Gammaproteobacteria bacterium]
MPLLKIILDVCGKLVSQQACLIFRASQIDGNDVHNIIICITVLPHVEVVHIQGQQKYYRASPSPLLVHLLLHARSRNIDSNTVGARTRKQVDK